ncbi:MAG: hypothetical protein GY953_57820 [bacterium]|nr:hypothetical protein [bacterium]
MSDNLQTLPQMAEALEDLGYEVGQQDDFVAVRVPVAGADPYTAVLTVDDERQKVIITCQLARYGDIAEDKLLDFLAAQSDANTRIQPFAFATLTNLDDPDRADADDWLFVLIDSLSLGDLADSELETAMADLQRAMPEVTGVLDIAKES